MIMVLLIMTTSILFPKKIVVPTMPISFQGQKYFKSSELYDALGIEHKSFFEFWKSDEPRIKKALIPTLEQSLESFYHSEGFYDAVFQIKQSSGHLLVTIKANKPVTIHDLNITSDFDLSDLIDLEHSQRFRTEDFIRSKKEIVEALLDKGYCSYDLDTKAYIDLQKHHVDLIYRLKKGETCTFGEVTFHGLKTIEEPIVYSRVRARKGELYSLKLINDTYDNLYQLDVFDHVQIDVDRKFYNVVPVDISLKETSKPYHLEAGAGYDTYEGFRVQAKWVKRNFLGNAQKLTLNTVWSQEEQLLEALYFRPDFWEIFGYDIDFGAKVGYSNLNYDGFKEEKEYMQAYLAYTAARLSIKSGLAMENIDISRLDFIPATAINEGNFLLFYPYIDIVYDARDSKFNPRYGYYLGAYLEYGMNNEEGASDYTKMLLEGRVIHTFGKLTLSGVGKIGAIEVKEGGLPESKYFFGGGPFSNRAYGYKELGVILSPTQDSIYGAASWLNLMLEANFPLWNDDIYGAVFVDNTMLNEEGYDFTGEVITSGGIGVRYMTPIGPLKLDIGVNVNDTSQYHMAFQIGHSF
jgi:translocation and assembly module TamA